TIDTTCTITYIYYHEYRRLRSPGRSHAPPNRRDPPGRRARGQRHRRSRRHPPIRRVASPPHSDRGRVRRDAARGNETPLLAPPGALPRARYLDLALPLPLGVAARPARRRARETEEGSRSH